MNSICRTTLVLILLALQACGRQDDNRESSCMSTAHFVDSTASAGMTIVSFEAQTQSCKSFFLERSGKVRIEIRVDAPRSAGRLARMNFGSDRTNELLISNPSGSGLSLSQGNLLYVYEPNKTWQLPWNDAPQKPRIDFSFPEGTEIAGMPYAVEIKISESP